MLSEEELEMTKKYLKQEKPQQREFQPVAVIKIKTPKLKLGLMN